MRQIYNHMFYSLKRIIFDTKSLISKLATIIIVILILGSAFQDAFQPVSLEKVTMAYCNTDSGEMGKEILTMMIEQEDVKQWVDFVEVKTFEEGETMVEEEKAAAMIFIGKDFSSKSQNNERGTEIEVYRGKYSGMDATVVQCVTDSFINAVNTGGIVYDMTGSLENYEFTLEGGLERQPLTSTGKVPNAMGYYAVAMLMMILIFGATYGCDGVGEDYLGVLGERIKTSPVKPYQQYLGKILGLALASFVEGVFVVLFTKFVFDVDWGTNYLMVLAIIFTMSFVATAIGAMVCMLTKNVSKGDSICSIIVIASTFLAGGFVKMDMGTLKFLSPSYYAQTAMFNTIYEGDMNLVYKYIGVLWVIALAAGVIAVLVARRKKA